MGILLSWYDRFVAVSGPAIPIIFAICWYLDDYLQGGPSARSPYSIFGLAKLLCI